MSLTPVSTGAFRSRAHKKPPRRFYHAVRVVASWWNFMLHHARCGDTWHRPTDDEEALWAVRTALLGAPASPSHHGPLSLETLTFGLADYLNSRPNVSALLMISSTKIFRVLGPRARQDISNAGSSAASRLRNSFLSAPPSPWLASRWSSGSVIEREWSAALADARKERLTTFRGLHPPRFECGRLATSLVQRCYCQPHSEVGVQQMLLLQDIARYSGDMPDRSLKFELENGLQEIGLCELVQAAIDRFNYHWRLVAQRTEVGGIQVVVDIGGGNGYLAHHMQRQLRLRAIVVDPFHPAHSIDNPQRSRQWRDTARADNDNKGALHSRFGPIRRIVKRAHLLDWDSEIGTHVYQPTSHAAIVSKHLCGTALDRCLKWLDIQGRLPSVLVLSPCCYNKGHRWEYVHQDFLASVLGVTTDCAWDRITKLTDWNHSLLRCKLSKRSGGPFVLESEWNYLMSDIAHAALDEGRCMWLRERGYEVEIVRFTPDAVSPKNVAIVAIHRGTRMLLSPGIQARH